MSGEEIRAVGDALAVARAPIAWFLWCVAVLLLLIRITMLLELVADKRKK